MKMINKKSWIAVGFWMFFFVMFFHMANYFHPIKYALISAAYTVSTMAAMYYLTVKYLFKHFYAKGNRYFIISLSIVAVLGIVFTLIDINLIPSTDRFDHEKPPIQFHFVRTMMGLAFTFLVGTSVGLIEQANKMKENEKLLTEEKLETELKLLKAQVNPHFIFNALNNIYSLTYMQSEKAPDSVLKLSEMLRYVFYDCNKDRVPLSAELKYIENFAAFQQMKSEFNQDITIQSEINGGNIEMAPMIFIPFIENAFKYSRIEENEKAFVRINIRNVHGKIKFAIENSMSSDNKPEAGSGMGIKNVQHRLAIIYPGKHQLNIKEEKNIYRLELQLETT